MIHNVLDLEWDPVTGGLLVLGYDETAYQANRIPQAVHNDLANPNVASITFTKADHRWLREHNWLIKGPLIDVQTMCWAYDERTPLDLDWCVKNYLGYDPDKRIAKVKGAVCFRKDNGEYVPLVDAPIHELMEYNRRDLQATRELYAEMTRRMKLAGVYDYWKEFHQPLSEVLLDMEMNGLPLDLDRTVHMQRRLDTRTRLYERKLQKDGGLPDEFNLNSRDQIAEFLFRKEFELPSRIRVQKSEMAELKEGAWPKVIPTLFDIRKLGRDYVHGAYELRGLGLKPKSRAPGCAQGTCKHAEDEHVPSTSTKTLKVEHGENPWVSTYCEFRATGKALQFLDKWLEVQKDGRIRTHFNQTGTATGRLSSSDPINLQNIPGRGKLGQEIRGLFRAPEGTVFVNGDYSQIEPRLMAHFSGDVELMSIFEKGLDLYDTTGRTLLGSQYGAPERQLVKGCFLAMGYGAQPKKIRAVLAEQGFFFPVVEVQNVMAGLEDLYDGFFVWKRVCIAGARAKGYVETLGGHRRHLDFGGGQSWKAELQAVNSKIQGSAADIMDSLLVMVSDVLPHWRPILQVHDEAMYEVDQVHDFEANHELKVFKDVAEQGHGFKLQVPLVFEPKVIKSWGDK